MHISLIKRMSDEIEKTDDFYQINFYLENEFEPLPSLLSYMQEILNDVIKLIMHD